MPSSLSAVRGSIMSQDNASKVHPSSRERLKKLMEEEKRPVKGIFRFHECPGGSTTIPMKKYPGEEVRNMTFTDGEEYTVPLWVARWLNGYDACAQERGGKINSCGYPVHEHAIDRNTGQPLVQIGQIRRRMAFESTEFMSV